MWFMFFYYYFFVFDILLPIATDCKAIAQIGKRSANIRSLTWTDLSETGWMHLAAYLPFQLQTDRWSYGSF